MHGKSWAAFRRNAARLGACSLSVRNSLPHASHSPSDDGGVFGFGHLARLPRKAASPKSDVPTRIGEFCARKLKMKEKRMMMEKKEKKKKRRRKKKKRKKRKKTG